ncbi:hypothetical protein K435DRAFT_828700 [Dendrothele bispora CBS 962.96]|uniref:Uncharacterized protein n=1 Tax=Dendrothele bispora (strain CBS 962.96) TaxID=1314807 RepID=A0A4S8M564_DENBC|nr:hypothetical protein K435DRAFT_828700 [Dendrothele bispora CBS 962.96]
MQLRPFTVFLVFSTGRPRPNPPGLEHCPGNSPGDADACTFEAQSQSDSTMSMMVGNPVENCLGDSNSTTTTVSTGFTVSQTFKFGVSEGFSVDGGEELPIGVSFQNSDTWSNTESKSFSQDVSITVDPGKKVSGMVVAQVPVHTFFGRVRVNYGDPTREPSSNDFHFIYFNNGAGSIQPVDGASPTFGQKIIGCDESF